VIAGVLEPRLTWPEYVPWQVKTFGRPPACCTAYPIVAYGAARVPFPDESEPFGETKTPKLSVT
jgi:hypothetical protein